MTSEEAQAKREEEEAQAKRVELYSHHVAAWVNSSLERDRSLLTLSVAGLGVLLTLMSTAVNSITALILYYLAVFALLMCIFSVLLIFQRNKKYIENVICGSESADPWLTILDIVAVCSFVIGILFCAIIGISSATSTYFEKGKIMATEKNSVIKINELNYTAESVNNMHKLVGDGIGRAVQLQPQQSEPVQPAKSNASQSQSSSAPSQENTKP